MTVAASVATKNLSSFVDYARDAQLDYKEGSTNS